MWNLKKETIAAKTKLKLITDKYRGDWWLPEEVGGRNGPTVIFFVCLLKTKEQKNRQET